ncbi:MAG TPA: caspase family protein [Saprospiraceae bacterium]|nr:caspase family protein [Saprospiraceae bacterium]
MKQTLCVLLLLCMSAGALPAQTPLLVVPTGHSSPIRSFTCTADGKYFVTLGNDDLIKFWNEEGKETRTIRTPAFRYMGLQMSPDKKHMLAISNYDYNEAYVLDIDSEKEILTLTGHTSGVRCAAYSPDGKTIATGAYDASVILWNARTGTILHRLSGYKASIVSLAFSPDGKLLATASEDFTVRIWETTGGKMVHAIETVETIPVDVQFSPDGAILSVGRHAVEKGVSLWSVKNWKKIRDLDGYSLRFSPDGHWISLSKRNAANLYRADQLEGEPVRSLQATPALSDGPMVIDAQSGYFLPDNKSILLSCAGGAPEVYDVETGQLKYALKGFALPVSCATFSPDGEKILVSSNSDLLEWDLTKGQLSRQLKGLQGNITNTQYTRDGQKIISVTENSTGAIRDAHSGKEILSLKPVYAVWPVQTYAEVLALSPDGLHFIRGNSYGITGGPPFLSAWSIADGSRVDSLYAPTSAEDAAYSPDGQLLAVAGYHSLLVRDVAARTWEKLADADHSFASGDNAYRYTSVVFFDNDHLAAGTSGGKVEFWNAREKKRIVLEAKPGRYGINDLACSPDGRWIAAGFLNKSIGLWRCEPNKMPQFVHSLEGHDDWIQQVEFSPDSRRLISTSQDNTVRIWDLEKKTEVAKLIHLNQNDWAVISPSGLFDASPGAMELMYFTIGNEVIELEQLKERYYEPGLLSKVMGLASGELRNVKQFKNLALYPKIEAKIEQNNLKVNLLPQNGGIGKLSLFVNDKEVIEDINPQRSPALNLDLKAYEKYYRSDTLNTLALRAYNAEGWLKSQAYRIPYAYVRAKGQGDAGEAPTLGDAKPRLFALVVGTADYSGDKLDLKYADQDATAIASALSAAGKELFGEGVQIQLFTTGNLDGNTSAAAGQVSSKTNIKKAFEALATQTRATDVLLLYFSGHGITYGEAEKAQFYYLTKDIASEDLSDPEVRSNFTISSDELTDWIKAIPALKQVLIFDACNSGKIVESLAAIGQKDLNPSQVRALDRMKDRTGMFILTGSAADKVSYEAGQFGQGLLTYSLLEGMSGLALGPEKRVDVMTLFQYSRDKVPEMAKSINGIQTPMLAFPANGGSFDIGIVNEKVRIPLAQVKPVFIRNNFQDEDAFEDVLGITDALEQNFRKMTAKGAQSKVIYVDVKEYENAYSMKGRYHVAGDAVEVRVRLFKGKTLVGEEFKVNGTKGDLPGLVKSILGEVMGRI